MKRFLTTRINLDLLNLAIFCVRVFIGLTMLSHGAPKLMKFMSGEPLHFADPLNIGVVPSLVLTVFAEVFCSICIIIGLGTRFAVVPLMITMLVAAFVVHIGDGFREQETALLYLLIYFTLFITGSGRYSIDRQLEKK